MKAYRQATTRFLSTRTTGLSKGQRPNARQSEHLVPASALVGDEGFYGTSREHTLAVLEMRHWF